jgi:hypothetical protein
MAAVTAAPVLEVLKTRAAPVEGALEDILVLAELVAVAAVTAHLAVVVVVAGVAAVVKDVSVALEVVALVF